jgi:hypothetical protein
MSTASFMMMMAPLLWLLLFVDKKCADGKPKICIFEERKF